MKLRREKEKKKKTIVWKVIKKKNKNKSLEKKVFYHPNTNLNSLNWIISFMLLCRSMSVCISNSLELNTLPKGVKEILRRILCVFVSKVSQVLLLMGIKHQIDFVSKANQPTYCFTSYILYFYYLTYYNNILYYNNNNTYFFSFYYIYYLIYD